MKTITKTEIKQALLTEPLLRGDWVDSYMDRIEVCPVCAVGAVIRNVFNPADEDHYGVIARKNIDNYYHNGFDLNTEELTDTIYEQIHNRDYLGALSNFFEHATTDRNRLVQFVDVCFPETLTLKGL